VNFIHFYKWRFHSREYGILFYFSKTPVKLMPFLIYKSWKSSFNCYLRFNKKLSFQQIFDRKDINSNAYLWNCKICFSLLLIVTHVAWDSSI